MRIVGGFLRGRRIRAPGTGSCRPTKDRVREAIFDILGARIEIEGSSFLDLYAGSGAVGIEAYSRGASRVRMVESDPAALKVIRENIEALGIRGGIEIARGRVSVGAALAGSPGGGEFDCVFIDPPYGEENYLEGLMTARIAVNPGGLIVLERSSKDDCPLPGGLEIVREYRHGATTLDLMTAPPRHASAQGEDQGTDQGMG